MAAVVLPLRRRFDPLAPEAEARYDEVVHRFHHVTARLRSSARRRQELERQFVEGDLVVASGTRRGQPLTLEGRRRRLAQLLSLQDTHTRLEDELRCLQFELESMNADLDAWARRTYGTGQ